MKVITILLAISLNITSIAQEIQPYTWQEKRTISKLSPQENELGLIYIKKLEKRQYQYDESAGSLYCFETIHQIIRVNNDEALNQSNKVYIPLQNTLDIVEIKARAISPDNKITDFDESNIKELESEDAGYKIFAIEGAEIGGEIEYYYTRKTAPSNFLTKTFQDSHPIKAMDFVLVCPENLEYDFKVYNWNNKVIQTDTTDDFNKYELHCRDIPALHEEPVSALSNNKARIEFKLAYNSNSGNSRLNSWGVAGKRIYEIIYDRDKKEEKALNKYFGTLDLAGPPLDAFRRAEHRIKQEMYYAEDAGPQGSRLDVIIKNKYANSRGFTRLFAALLEHLQIQHEVVLTSDRMKKRFDADFDSWNYLDEFFIYVNEANAFVTPKDIALRMGTIPFNYYGQEGLFIRPEPIQSYIYPVAHIKYIPEESYQDNMIINVEFTEDMTKNRVHIDRVFKGYNAQYYKTALMMLPEDDRKKMLDEIVKYFALDAEIESLDVVQKNTEYQNWTDEFEVSSIYTSESYIENAGNVILFKVGELIGPQSEMYQEDERKLPVDNGYNRGYDRKITINLPEGYTIQNPENLVKKEQVYEGDRLLFNFDSTYEIEDGKIVIQIDEFYDQLTYPAEKFDQFREVINAAADWNKVVLVMEK
jgi:hypothetical protein